MNKTNDKTLSIELMTNIKLNNSMAKMILWNKKLVPCQVCVKGLATRP